jgi:hypothetical protein
MRSALVTVRALHVDDAEFAAYTVGDEPPPRMVITESAVLLFAGDIVTAGIAPDGSLYLQDNDGLSIVAPDGSETRTERVAEPAAE